MWDLNPSHQYEIPLLPPICNGVHVPVHPPIVTWWQRWDLNQAIKMKSHCCHQFAMVYLCSVHPPIVTIWWDLNPLLPPICNALSALLTANFQWSGALTHHYITIWWQEWDLNEIPWLPLVMKLSVYVLVWCTRPPLHYDGSSGI